MPRHILDWMQANYPDIHIYVLHDMEPALRDCDILYMTRIQKAFL